MRHILKLHRDLDSQSLPQAEHDYTIETFDSALHKQQWLDLNNLIFSHHPDQGNWVMQDLENRMNEPWFDPQGSFLATENGAIEGFVWTKIQWASYMSLEPTQITLEEVSPEPFPSRRSITL